MKISYIKFCVILYVILYAGILASLPFEGLTDRISYISTLNNIIQYRENYIKIDNYKIFLVSDPAWYSINYILASFLPTEWAIRLIIFFGSLTTLGILTSLSSLRWLPLVVLLSFTPAFLTHYIGHLRQGFALTLLVISYYSWYNKPRFSKLVLLFAIFTHNIAIIILLLIGFKNLLLKFFAPFISLLIFTFIVYNIFNNSYISNILQFFQHRQFEYYNNIEYDPSGRVLAIVFLMLICFLIKPSFLKSNGAYALTFYLTTYFTLPMSARIFESMFVLLICQVVQSEMKQWHIPTIVVAIYTFGSLGVYTVYN